MQLNTFQQVREIGVKLYLLWLQDLQENIDELGLLVYGSIIPGFPSPVDKIDRSKIYRPQNFIDSIYPCISGSGMVATQQSQYTSYLDIDTGIHQYFYRNAQSNLFFEFGLAQAGKI